MNHFIIMIEWFYPVGVCPRPPRIAALARMEPSAAQRAPAVVYLMESPQ